MNVNELGATDASNAGMLRSGSESVPLKTLTSTASPQAYICSMFLS